VKEQPAKERPAKERPVEEPLARGAVVRGAEGLAAAVAALRAGECVGMPTETVYGLAADALDERAVARVFEAKGRPHFDPLIVHVAPEHDPRRWVALTPTAERLIEALWPGPLTLLVPKRDVISDLVTSGHPTVALRCPAHPAAQALLRAFGGPLVAPSANPFGRISPTTAEAVRAGLGARVALVLDGGACAVGLESTIVDATAPWPSLPVLRLGGVPPEALEALGARLSYPTPLIGQAPGTLKNHYAPRKPLYLVEGALPARVAGAAAEAAYLAWGALPEGARGEVLAPSGGSVEGAARLFAAMRALDDSPAPHIIAELPPPGGLGLAIADRLRRAASGFARWGGGGGAPPEG